MQDIFERLAQLKRPKLLVRAAGTGAQHYDRGRDLRRLLPAEVQPQKHTAIILKLMDLERDFDIRRRTHGAGYSPADHLDVMIALVGEMQLLRTAHR